MICRHLEQLFMDIKSQGISENHDDQNKIEFSHESIWFNCYLDRKSIRKKHNFPDFVTDYVFPETDGMPKEGLICIQCSQAIIGLHKGYLPGSKTFAYDDTGQPHVFYFEDSNSAEDIEGREKPSQGKKKRRGLASILFAILLGVPIALYQYMPHNMILGFISGVCALILAPLILSPITQKIRGKDQYSFPFAPIIIMLVIGTPVFVLYGWQAVYYTLAGYTGLLFFFSILLRLFKKKD